MIKPNQSIRLARRVYLLSVTLALAWTVTAAFIPLVETRMLDRPSSRVTVLAIAFIRAAYGHVCHQIADRSLQIGGQPMAVCARCFGIYLGYVAGLAIYPLVRKLDGVDTPRRLWLLLALIPVSIDFLGGYLGWFENTHASRMVTGLVAGAAGAFYTLPGLVSLAVNRVLASRQGSSKEPAMIRAETS